MENQENENFFGNLPHDELQSLCKKHGLSTKKTNSQLAKQLVSYYKLSNSAGDVGTKGPPSKGTAEGFGCSNYQLEEITRQQPISGSLYDENASTLESKEPPESSGAGNIPQIQNGNMKLGVFPSDSNLVSSNESSVEVPSAFFEFYVRSDEGINLCVDLNSSPTNWIKRLKSEVCIPPNIQNSDSRVLHRELEKSGESAEQMKAPFLGKTGVDFQTKGDPKYIESSLTSIARESGINHPDRTERMLPSNNAVEISSLVGENNPMVSSICKPDSGLKNPIVSCSDCCVGNGETVTLGSEVPNISQTTSTGKFLVDSKSGGSKLFDSSENQSKSDSTSPENNGETVPMLTSVSIELDPPTFSKICKDLIPQDTIILENCGGVGHRSSASDSTGMSEVAGHCDESKLFDISENQSKSDSISPENNGETVPMLTSVSIEIDPPMFSKMSKDLIPQDTIILGNRGGVDHRFSASDSVGMQLSEVAGHCEDTLSSPRQSCSAPEMYHGINDLLTANGGSLKDALNRNTCSDPFYACAEEWGGSNPINERESSECSQINNLLKRTYKSSNTLDHEGIQSKRQHTNSEDHDSNAAKLARKVLPRRSSRLVSK